MDTKNTNPTQNLTIGALVFPRMDQIDLTGPFEVLSRLPDSAFHLIGKTLAPVRDIQGLILTPEIAIADAPQLDVLVVPGGFGQQDLMDDEEVLAFLRSQAAGAQFIFSICTGALLLGGAGLLRNVRATTHWSTQHLLQYFGAIPVDERVVIDGRIVTAAGVTSGIDGALRLAALLRGDIVAQTIQLGIEYAPDPPFSSGSPKTAPLEVLNAARDRIREISERRLKTAKQTAGRLGVALSEER
jgi:cyclohexyl-isocyanide hydratase